MFVGMEVFCQIDDSQLALRQRIRRLAWTHAFQEPQVATGWLLSDNCMAVRV